MNSKDATKQIGSCDRYAFCKFRHVSLSQFNVKPRREHFCLCGNFFLNSLDRSNFSETDSRKMFKFIFYGTQNFITVIITASPALCPESDEF